MDSKDKKCPSDLARRAQDNPTKRPNSDYNDEELCSSSKVNCTSMNSLLKQEVATIKLEEHNFVETTAASVEEASEGKHSFSDCTCSVNLDSAIAGIYYFKKFPKRLQEQESFCHKKLKEVNKKIVKLATTLRADQDSMHEYDRLIAEASSLLEAAQDKLKETEKELGQKQKEIEFSTNNIREKEAILRKEFAEVLEFELLVRTKQCDQVRIKLEALNNVEESFHVPILDKMAEEISNLKKELSSKKEQVNRTLEQLKPVRENLAQLESALQECREKLQEQSRIVQVHQTQTQKYKDEKKELEEVVDNSIMHRRKNMQDKIELEKHLLKLSFVKAHDALERKAQFYQNVENFFEDYKDESQFILPD